MVLDLSFPDLYCLSYFVFLCGNTRTPMSVSSPIQTHKHYNIFPIAPTCKINDFVHCEIFEFKHLNINKRCNTFTQHKSSAHLDLLCVNK